MGTIRWHSGSGDGSIKSSFETPGTRAWHRKGPEWNLVPFSRYSHCGQPSNSLIAWAEPWVKIDLRSLEMEMDISEKWIKSEQSLEGENTIRASKKQ